MLQGQQHHGSLLFARLLRQARTQRAWSQARLAEALGTDPMTISRWERGLTLPTPALREQLCALFEKTPQDFGLLSRQDTTPDASGFPAFLVDPMLPANRVLVGRDPLLRQIKRRFLSSQVVALCALNGLPGIGKTALAVHLAHERDLRRQFDGVLWAGVGPTPEVSSHLSRWGHLLGLSADECRQRSSVESWRETLRWLLAERQMLIILDDIWHLEDALAFQVGEHCAYLLTTRLPDIALHFGPASQVAVQELDGEASLALLRLLAPEVMEQEPRKLRALVQAVGGLPLALTLIGNYLRKQAYSQQRRRIQAALLRLSQAEERLRLAEPLSPLESHPSLSRQTLLSLHSAIAVSDQQLSAPARTALYALSVFPSKPNSFSEEAACVVADCSQEVLDALSDAGLLEHNGTGRYMLHQTIADYARLHQQDNRCAQRFITYVLTFLDKHASHYDQLERESSLILAALESTITLRQPAALVQATLAFTPFLLTRGRYPLAAHYVQQAREAAEGQGDRRSCAWLALYQGEVAQKRGDFGQAITSYEDGLGLARDQGDQELLCRLLTSLGWVHDKVGNYAQAEVYTREGLALAQALGERELICRLLAILGATLADTGLYLQAQTACQEGLALARALADPELLCHLLINAGYVAYGQGHYERLERYCQEGLPLARQMGHREWTILLLLNLGAAVAEQRRFEQAATAYQEGLALARHIGHREWIAYLLSNLAELALDQDQESQAANYQEENLRLARQLGQPALLCQALENQGRLLLKRKLIEQATACYQEILDLGAAAPQMWHAMAYFGLARVAVAQGHVEQARTLGLYARALLEATSKPYMRKVDDWLLSLPAPS